MWVQGLGLGLSGMGEDREGFRAAWDKTVKDLGFRV
jgi:hypothetical protein